MLLKKGINRNFGYMLSYRTSNDNSQLMSKMINVRKDYFTKRFALGQTRNRYTIETNLHGFGEYHRDNHHQKDYHVKSMKNGIITDNKKYGYTLNGKDHGPGFNIMGHKYTYFVGDEDRTRYRE